MARKRKNLLICFTGIDGSGKTTLARNLSAALRGYGIPNKYVWGAYELMLLKPIVALGDALFLRGKKASADYSDYYQSLRRWSGKKILAWLYRNLTLAEYFLQILFKVRLPLLLGRSVVSDRYAYDTLISLAVNLGLPQESFRATLRGFLRLCPRPDLVFLVDLPEEVAYQRKGDIPALEYLRRRRELYLSLPQDYEMTVLDGSRDKEELSSLIEGLVTEGLPLKGKPQGAKGL